MQEKKDGMALSTKFVSRSTTQAAGQRPLSSGSNWLRFDTPSTEVTGEDVRRGFGSLAKKDVTASVKFATAEFDEDHQTASGKFATAEFDEDYQGDEVSHGFSLREVPPGLPGKGVRLPKARRDEVGQRALWDVISRSGVEDDEDEAVHHDGMASGDGGLKADRTARGTSKSRLVSVKDFVEQGRDGENVFVVAPAPADGPSGSVRRGLTDNDEAGRWNADVMKEPTREATTKPKPQDECAEQWSATDAGSQDEEVVENVSEKVFVEMGNPVHVKDAAVQTNVEQKDQATQTYSKKKKIVTPVWLKLTTKQR